MNIHPIFVHFPIALLCFYTFFEVFRLPILMRQSWMFPTKAVLLIGGIAGGWASLETGEMAEEAYRGTSDMPLVHLHSEYAEMAMAAYGILAALYVIKWINDTEAKKWVPSFLQKPWGIVVKVQRKVFVAPILILGSITGLVLITVTGALGGAIVYGPEVDPVVSFFYHLLYK